jgi:hypothetical protein
MKGWFGSVCALAIVVASAPVFAETTSETLFKHKHWEVEIVGFDDGSVACLAEVDATTESFTVWVYPDQSVKLQFYSTSWEFGEGDTANLDVKIDRRASWDLTNAELYKNSILFNLPDSNAGVRFLTEIAQGQRLYLRSADKSALQDYSLAGSRASMDALIQCSDAIR